MDPKACSGADLGRCFDVDRSMVTRWKKAGMPHRNGVFTLSSCIRWHIERAEEAMAPKDADPESIRWLTIYRKERAKRARLERLKLQGDLVSVPEVLAAQAQVSGAVRNSVRSWASRLPPMLEGKTADEMLPAIRAEVDQSLRILSAQIVDEPIEKKTTKEKTHATR